MRPITPPWFARPWHPWIVFGVINTAILAVAVKHYAGNQLDFGVYFAQTQAWVKGDPLYGAVEWTSYGRGFPFTYPPFAALLMSPLAFTTYPIGSLIFTILIMACFGVALYFILRSYGSPHWAFGIALPIAIFFCPVAQTLGFGQINALLLLLVALDCLVKKPKWPRGILIGIAAAIKLTPAVFILYFLLKKDARAALLSVLSFIACALIGFLAAPKVSIDFWTRAMFQVNRVGDGSVEANQSLHGLIIRLHLSTTLSHGIWAVAALGVIVLATMAIRKTIASGDFSLAMGLTGLVGLLLAPISWVHHWVWIIPIIIGLLITAYRHRNSWVALLTATSVLLFTSDVFDWGSYVTRLLFSPGLASSPYVWFGLCLLVFIASRLWPVKKAPKIAALQNDVLSDKPGTAEPKNLTPGVLQQVG